MIKYFLIVFCLVFSVSAQKPEPDKKSDENDVMSEKSIKLNRERGLVMLSDIKDIIKDMYYDKNFHGVDIDARFDVAEKKIRTLDSNGQIFYVIAAVVLELKDSHTTFYPPGRQNRVEYGFTMQMVGSKCYVTDVKKGSDAEKKGLKAGDVILGIGPYEITRDSLWLTNYFLYGLSPQERLKLFVLGMDNVQREMTVESGFRSLAERRKEADKRRNEKRANPYRCQKINEEVIACRLETFSVEKKFIDKMMEEVKPFKKLIFDLRGNGGGLVSIEEYLTGHFFDREVKIGTQVTRKKSSDHVARPQGGDKNFKGELLVLLDSRSASASEVFARTMQIEKRGKVVGDVSAGAVMTSRGGTLANARGLFDSKFALYGINITVADLIMSDGKRLEKVGVTPDYPFGPSGKAFAEKLDPVLSYAAKIFGAELTSQDAGKINFIVKKAEDEEEEKSEDEDN